MTPEPIAEEIARLRAWAWMREAARTRAVDVRGMPIYARSEITDERGLPRMVIHCPRERRAYSEERGAVLAGMREADR